MLDSKSEILGSPHPDRKKLITEIQDTDRQVFEDWSSKSRFSRELPTETAILRYLIPPRIWDFVADPRRLNVLVTEKGKELLFFVVEHTDQPLTNMESLNIYYDRTTRPEGGLPPDIDQFHWDEADYVLEGTIPVTDKIYTMVKLKPMRDELYVVAYQDREELQRKGIATSFYQRLREVSKELGFRYITGENSEKNKSFFTEKLGRISFDELPENLQLYFESHHAVYGGEKFFDEDFTVDFINPEGKPRQSK